MRLRIATAPILVTECHNFIKPPKPTSGPQERNAAPAPSYDDPQRWAARALSLTGRPPGKGPKATSTTDRSFAAKQQRSALNPA
jgi:hypothetical protein